MTISLVTGAGSGIGAATARTLGARGDRVVCADLDMHRAEALAAELGEAVAVQADVADEASSTRMVEAAIDAYGDLDVLVACAGIEIGGDALAVDAATFRRVVDVNLTGSFLSAQHAARAMRDHR